MKKRLNFEIKDIYPNPSAGYFTFTFIAGNGTQKSKLQVSICNTNGLPLVQKEFDNLISSSQYTVKTEQLINGIYDVIFNINNVKVLEQIKVFKPKAKQHTLHQQPKQVMQSM